MSPNSTSTTQKRRFIKCSNNCANVGDRKSSPTGKKILIKEHNGNAICKKGRRWKMSLESSGGEDALSYYICKFVIPLQEQKKNKKKGIFLAIFSKKPLLLL